MRDEITAAMYLHTEELHKQIQKSFNEELKRRFKLMKTLAEARGENEFAESLRKAGIDEVDINSATEIMQLKKELLKDGYEIGFEINRPEISWTDDNTLKASYLRGDFKIIVKKTIEF